MRQARAIGVACAFAAATIGAARDASASGPSFDLDYSVPANCPSQETFVADVNARIADRRGVPADRRRFQIRIVEGKGGFRGALETLEPSSVREVAGESCEEVVRALVVFLALAVSPAESEALTSTSAPAPHESTAALEGEAAAIGPVPPRSASDSSAHREPRPSPFGVDLRGLVATGVAPGVAPGGAVAARVVLARRPSLRWVMHVGGLFTYREESVLDGQFSFLWTAGRLDVGPALDVGRFRVSGGVAARAGLLTVRAQDLPSAGNYSAFWGDVGLFARVDHALSSTVGLSLMIELAAPLKRRAFGIQGVDVPVHEIPPAIGLVSLGLSLGK